MAKSVVIQLMKLVLQILIVLTLLINPGFHAEIKAQKLTKDFFEAWVIHLDSSSIELMDQAVYILNGSPFRSTDAFSVLSDYNFDKQKIQFTYLSPERASRFNHQNGPVIVLSTNIGTQKRKRVKETLEKAHKLFEGPIIKTSHGVIHKKEPAVILDGKPLDSVTSRTILEKIDFRLYETILVSETPPSKLYGENAKNGLIRIWLKK
ncbi:MAG: hypothetical protein Roseis2KO_39440 [Roseivirga sp.]